MGKSSRVRSREERAISRLLLNMVCVRHEINTQYTVMLEGLCKLTGADRALAFCLDDLAPNCARPRFRCGVDYGWDATNRDRFRSFVTEGDLRIDGVINRAATTKTRLVAICKDEWFDRRAWAKGIHDGESRGIGGVSDLLGCLFRHDGIPTRASAVALHRMNGIFAPRDLAILRRFNRERFQLYLGDALGIIEDKLHVVPHLTPRERKVLSGLLDGLCYKDIGKLNEIGTETVKEHARTIYRKHAVADRAELSALLLRLPVVE